MCGRRPHLIEAGGVHVRTTHRAAVVLTAALCVLALSAPDAAGTSPSSLPGRAAQVPTPPPPPGSLAQIAALAHAGRLRDAALVLREVTMLQAVWFTQGTPAQVRAEVRLHGAGPQAAACRALVGLATTSPTGTAASTRRPPARHSRVRRVDRRVRGRDRRRLVIEVLDPDGLGHDPECLRAGRVVQLHDGDPARRPGGPGPPPRTGSPSWNHAVDATSPPAPTSRSTWTPRTPRGRTSASPPTGWVRAVCSGRPLLR